LHSYNRRMNGFDLHDDAASKNRVFVPWLTPLLSAVAGVISLFFVIMSCTVILAMWPGILLIETGSFIANCLIIFLVPIQLWVFVCGKHGLSLSIFASDLVLFALFNAQFFAFGPPTCSWGPYQGLFDCGLPTALSHRV